MRYAVAGLLVIAGLVVATLALAAPPGAVYAGRGSASAVSGSSHLVTLSSPLGDNRQQLVLIDPEQQVMSVYHVDSSGEIVLKSVRNIHWDLQMEQFNGTNPLPREIRAQLDGR